MNISLLSWYCGKNKIRLKNRKKWHEWYSKRDRQLQCRARSPLNHSESWSLPMCLFIALFMNIQIFMNLLPLYIYRNKFIPFIKTDPMRRHYTIS